MKFNNKTLAPLVLAGIFIVLIILLFLSTGVNGETDSIAHYQLSRYAFQHPEFFVDHWGKPLFTILSSPLAQFGYTGAIVFNLICGLLSAWFAYLIVKRMNYRHAWVAMVFTVFTPIYLFIMFSSLTEILFSLVLISAIYLFVSKRFFLSAIVISLIPFARTEGVIFIVLFIPALICMKQYKALPFLLSGFVFFSLLGLPVHHDLFWFFTKMPYSTGSSAFYGHGSFWIYFRRMVTLMNYPLLILGLTGMGYILANLKKGLKNLGDIKIATMYFLIIPCFFGYILAQSFLWWKGLGVLVSDRFIASVLPLSAILASTGFEWIMERVKLNKIIYWVTGAFIVILVVYKPFTYKILPTKTGQSNAAMQELTTWLKASPYHDRQPYFTDPMFPFYMGLDPFDPKKSTKVFQFDNIDPASILKPGELLIWDAHFAGYEGHLPFDTVMNNNNLRLLKIFMPKQEFTVFGNIDYKLAIFMKAPRDTTRSTYKQLYFNDFENGFSAEQMNLVSTEFSSGGKQSILLTPKNVYSPGMEHMLIDLPGTGDVWLRASVRILNPSADEIGKINLVISIDDREHKIFKYKAVQDSEVGHKPGEWFSLTLTAEVDRNIAVGGWYKIYVWYTGKNKIYVDNLKLEYLPVGTE